MKEDLKGKNPPNTACTDEVGSQGPEGSCKQKDEPNRKQFGPSLVGVFGL
jgi:hypothetical protein